MYEVNLFYTCVVAAENVAVDNSIAVAEAPNAYDKVIALVKTYTKRIKAARSFEELEDYEKVFNAAMEELMRLLKKRVVNLWEKKTIIIKTGSIQHSDRI